MTRGSRGVIINFSGIQHLMHCQMSVGALAWSLKMWPANYMTMTNCYQVIKQALTTSIEDNYITISCLRSLFCCMLSTWSLPTTTLQVWWMPTYLLSVKVFSNFGEFRPWPMHFACFAFSSSSEISGRPREEFKLSAEEEVTKSCSPARRPPACRPGSQGQNSPNS
jgi:hypothetical protein